MIRMSEKIASPTIEETFKNFLKDPLFGQVTNLRADERETALELIQSYAYYHGYNYLSFTEQTLHDQFHQQAPPAHKGFHQIFGPDKLVLLVPPFLDFIAHELTPVASQKFIVGNCSVLEELCLWLIKNELVDPESGEEAAYCAATAARVLPRAMRALKNLHKEAQMETAEEIRWTGSGESEIYHIARIQSEMLWLETEDGETVGPINISARVKVDLEVGWEIHCSLIKRHSRWLIIGLGGIFPVFTV